MLKGFLLINKPTGLSSFAIIYKLRKVTTVKKIGHAGTLDPFATGLLICAIDKEFTKQIYKFQDMPKAYEVTMVLGIGTDTYDAYGQISEHNKKEITLEDIQQIIPQFLGEQDQCPPIYSAKKVNGERMYKLARQKVAVEIKPHRINITNIEILDFTKAYLPICKLKVECSKGTYIRSLVYDMGQKLGVPSYAKELKRTKIGDYNLEQALEYDELTEEKIAEKIRCDV